MFNWLYASIGVALGVAGGTFNGVIVYILIIGFLIVVTSGVFNLILKEMELLVRKTKMVKEK